MSRSIIGIVGGMGPEATVDLYREIIRLTNAKTDQEHLPVLIYSNPQVPDRTKAILEGGEDPMPYLIHTAQVLERAGAGILVVPCNAAHYFVPRVQEYVGIRILNMIEETCKAFRLRIPGGTAVGLLAATGTVKSGIYAEVFARAGVEVLAPDDAEQRRVHSAIHSVKAGDLGPQVHEIFESTGVRLIKAGAQSVILGCTEIPLAFDELKVDYPSLNPTRVLAQAAVDWALGKRE
jgi:aspartate racemase